MGLRIAVQQQERRAITGAADENGGVAGVDVTGVETGKEIREAHDPLPSRSTARQPMSRRQNPSGQSMASTAA